HAWDPIVPLLADHHRVVVVDLPGHGESPDVPADAEPVSYMADRLAEFVREVTPAGERPHIAGNSLGGFLGLELGARGLASGVTALSPAGFFRSDADRRHAGRLFSSIIKAAAVAGPAIPALSRTTIGRSLFMAVFCARPWRYPAEAMAIDGAAIGDNTVVTRLLDGDWVFSEPVDEQLPITVRWGRLDAALLVGQATQVPRVFPQARVERTWDGHVPMTDDPAGVAATIAADAHRGRPRDQGTERAAGLPRAGRARTGRPRAAGEPVLPRHDGRRPRLRRAAVGPVGGGVLDRGSVGLARVLDVDEGPVREHQRAAGLGTDRHGEEQLGLATVRTRDGHRVQAVVEAERVAVRGDPQPAGRVERHVIRAGDRAHLGLVEAAEVAVGLLGVAAHQQQVPAERGPRVVVGDLHDLAVLVGVPRVGLVRRRVAVDPAVGVVGQRHVDLAGGRAGLDVLGAVHLGGAHPVPGETGEHGDLLGRHPVDMGDGVPDGVHGEQRDPGAGAVERAVRGHGARAVDLTGGGVAGERGHVEGALVEDAHVLGAGRGAAAGGHSAARDELVEVVEALVVAGVDDDGAVVGDVDGAALVLEAAERRVLDRCRVGVPGIHLDDVAEAVDLVGLGGEVEAAVELLPPPVGRVGRDPVAVQLLEARRVGDLPRGAEVLVEVLLAGEHGAPRGVRSE